MNPVQIPGKNIKIEEDIPQEVDNEEIQGEISSEVDHCIETEQGKWSAEENQAFIMFMDYYKSIFCNKNRRKKSKIYTYFSYFIKTRTPRQCRSKYQKIMAYFNSFTKAKKCHLNTIGPEAYEAKFERFIRKLESQDKYLKIKRVAYGRPKKQKPADNVKIEQNEDTPKVLLPSTSNNIPKTEQISASPQEKEYSTSMPFFFTYLAQFPLVFHSTPLKIEHPE